MREKMMALKNFIVKLIKDKFADVLKWVLDKPAKRIVAIIFSVVGVSVGASQMETVIRQVQTYVVDEKMRHQLEIVVEQNRQLYAELKTANSVNLFQQREFEKRFNQFAQETDRNMGRMVDSISRLNQKITEFSKGQGTVVIDGHGKAKQGRFSDDWIDATITPLDIPGEYDLWYELGLYIKDISATVETSNGVKNEVYSVNVVSKKNPEAKMYIGDYVRTTTVAAEAPAVIEKPQSNTLNAGISYSGYGLEGALSYSFWTFGNWKLPDVMASSDFENSANLSLGIRYNIGDPLPLFTNLWLTLGYGYNFIQGKDNVLIGIGTTL